jgi:glutamate dehydrogenase/leucine dehydrogenase
MEDGKNQTMEKRPSSITDFFKNQFTKPLGPSLGGIRMWTKENDHASKSKRVDFFYICFKRAIL